MVDDFMLDGRRPPPLLRSLLLSLANNSIVTIMIFTLTKLLLWGFVICKGNHRRLLLLNDSLGATTPSESTRPVHSSSDDDTNEETPSAPRVCVLKRRQQERDNHDTFDQVADDLAERLQLPSFTEQDLMQMEPHLVPPLALVVEPYSCDNNKTPNDNYVIALQSLTDLQGQRRGRGKKLATKPASIDFLLSSRGGQDDLLVKAVKPTAGATVVWDLTAGWGQDAAVLARAGARVCLVERHAVVAALLQDALRRLDVVASSRSENNDNTSDSLSRQAWDLSNRLTLRYGDGVAVAQDFMTRQPTATEDGEWPDVVYLDPMFPTRKKAAAVKKNMQLLHHLLDSQQQQQQQQQNDESRLAQERALLQVARRLARSKVVVKRPIHAAPLGEHEATNHGNAPSRIKPSYDIRGSINRWDVYVIAADKKD